MLTWLGRLALRRRWAILAATLVAVARLHRRVGLREGARLAEREAPALEPSRS